MVSGSSLMVPDARPASTTVRSVLSGLGTEETFAAGETVLSRDSASEHLYLVEDGEVSLTLGDSVSTAGLGALFGENGFLEGVELVTAVARRPSRVRRISRGEVANAFSKHPRMLYVLLDELEHLKRARGFEDNPSPADRFVASLADQALSHRAVRHPYLEKLGAGALPDLRWALRDFATQYYGYSRHFPRYLTTVMSRLEVPEHRKALLDNLTEESGSYEDDELRQLAEMGVEADWFVGEPHPHLFRRFALAMGASVDRGQEADEVVCWREMFLDILRNGTPAEAVGALGIGTENIVSTIYKPFVQAIRQVDVDPRDSVFFVLHTAIDDHHQEVLQRIAASFAHSEAGRIDLRRGVLKALQLRAAFWDWLLERAEDPWKAEGGL